MDASKAVFVVFAAAAAAWAAQPPQDPRVIEPPPEVREIEKLQAEYAKKLSPELHAYQRRLRTIGLGMQKVKERFARGELEREEAKRQLIPLLKEQREILEDPDFLAEQQLAQGFYSSPEFRAKLGEAMRKRPGEQAPPPRRQPTP